jgi:3-deoxy-7-phosphoheptulonate synthase
VVESAEQAKIDELYHQFKQMPIVSALVRTEKSQNPLQELEPVKFKAGNRWVGRGSRPVLIAGSPYLESQKQAVALAGDLARIGVNIYKAGPYRPTETLPPKALYDRTGSIIGDISKRSGIPSTGMVEVLGPRTALSALDAFALHVPGRFLFDANLQSQVARIGLPVLLERHSEASTSLWLEAAGAIVAQGNSNVALVEPGRRLADQRTIDLVECARLVDTCPLPLIVYPSLAARSAEEVRRIARGALAAGASGIMIDVHPDPAEGLLTEGFCLSLKVFEEMFQSLRPLLA